MEIVPSGSSDRVVTLGDRSSANVGEAKVEDVSVPPVTSGVPTVAVLIVVLVAVPPVIPGVPMFELLIVPCISCWRTSEAFIRAGKSPAVKSFRTLVPAVVPTVS